MKKIIAFSLISLCLLPFILPAQDSDPKAVAALDAVNKKYKSMSAFQAFFSMQMTNQQTKQNESLSGKIVVKGAKFYLELPDQHVITDGKTQWTFLKDGNEVNITNYQPDEDEITPDRIYSLYQKKYKCLHKGEASEQVTVEGKPQNRVYEIVELYPKNPQGYSFFKIQLKIVKASQSIKSWEIYENNGNRFLYTVTKFQPVNVGDSYFKYNASKYPSKPEVIDLR
ncbi:MAG: LolA-like putative outer membrane lipoprotein chaperone [Microscillaceae bacterium]